MTRAAASEEASTRDVAATARGTGGGFLIMNNFIDFSGPLLPALSNSRSSLVKLLSFIAVATVQAG